MIQLSDEQLQSIRGATGTPATVVDPRTQETFVVLQLDDYHRLLNRDDSPLTPSERQNLWWHNLVREGREDEWSEYDDPPETT